MTKDSVNDGKALEAQVAILLRASGYTVRTEELLGTKRTDLVAETLTFGKHKIYAVECKDYHSKLTREHVARILTEYSDLLQHGLIDAVLLVTRNGLSPNAAAFVRESRTCAHQTVGELERSVIDFSSYLNHLVTSYKEDNLSHYYVPPQTPSGDDILKLVLDWLSSESTRPLAVLASYGMGKTTFSRHLAAILADQALMDPTARLPILIPLGLISAEQTLSGLLGRQFTDIHSLRQYSFSGFDTLNRLGKLIILLDGFDEMKHTLSWHEFRYNFQQLLQLVVPNSKVVVLGRPTAFISDAEHIHILHGKYSLNGQEFHIPDWPDFIELELAAFDNEQITLFLDRYFEHMKLEDSYRNKDKVQEAIKRTKRLADGMSLKHIRDLARRPVQLAMLAEILPHWHGDFSTLTVATLYDHFIDLMIERELDKISRQKYPSDHRRRFAREVAWWLWTEKAGSGLTPDIIPEQIVRQFADEKDNIEAVRRDLTSACFLEKKLGGALYFPHRSFQEFLVAEKVYDLMDNGESAFAVVNLEITGEVADFLSGIADAKVLIRWLGRLESYRGTVKLTLFTVLMDNVQVRQSVSELTSESDRRGDIVQAAKRANPWYSLLRVVLAQKQGEGLQSHRTTINYFLSNIKPNTRFHPAVLNLFCAIAVAGFCEDRKRKELIRVLEEGRTRLQAIKPSGETEYEDNEYRTSLDNDESPEENVQESMEASYDSRTRSRHGPQVGRKTSGRTGDRLTEFMVQTGLSRGETIPIPELLQRAAHSLRGYAIFKEWIDPRADLASEFTLPAFVTLGSHSTTQSKSFHEPRDNVAREARVKQNKTVKRDPRGPHR